MAEGMTVYELWRNSTDYLHVRASVKKHSSTGIRYEILEWIEENCVGKYTSNGSNHDWFFELESDALAFKLRWA